MTDDELAELPPLLTVPVAARVLGIGRTVAYRLVRNGTWPTPVIKVGNQVRIPRMPLLTLIGLSTEFVPPPEVPGRLGESLRRERSEDARDDVQALRLP